MCFPCSSPPSQALHRSGQPHGAVRPSNVLLRHAHGQGIARQSCCGAFFGLSLIFHPMPKTLHSQTHRSLPPKYAMKLYLRIFPLLKNAASSRSIFLLHTKRIPQRTTTYFALPSHGLTNPLSLHDGAPNKHAHYFQSHQTHHYYYYIIYFIININIYLSLSNKSCILYFVNRG